jgi:hypothetical protein
MKAKISVFILLAVALTACKDTGRTLPTVNGSKFEVLIVMEDAAWKTPAGHELRNLLSRDMECLPQAEPTMKVSHCNRAAFSDFLKPSRNIVLTDISEKYSAPKVTYFKNNWAAPQSLVKIVAPNDTSFENTIKKYGEQILDYFVLTERERQIAFNKDYLNVSAKTEIEKIFGIQVDIPQGISKVTKGKNFYWITNDNPGTRMDLIIYTYPYTDKNTFTKNYLLAKRDSVLKANIPGEIAGSYMGTEYRFIPPVFKEIWVNQSYCAEIKGLWKMQNGAAMGGPFYSQTRLDEINQRVVTVEGFVFAPGTKKRNAIRQLEAVVYTTKLPQEINALKEVSVVAPKKKK